ncbi:unnamed protein product [Bathycoccus prasinos]
MLNCTVDSQRRHERVATAWLHDICVKRKYIQPFYVESKHNIADVMTKACVVGGRRAHEALLLLATGHHEGSWIDWIRKLTEEHGAFQKNDNLVKLEDYHNELQEGDPERTYAGPHVRIVYPFRLVQELKEASSVPSHANFLKCRKL